MAKLITKFKYLKPTARRNVGGYAKYIATREGVEKIDRSHMLAPCSVKQKKLIERILRDFPDCKEMLEYEDYRNNPTNINASDFISRALEDNANEAMQTKTYADYIATRLRAQRFGSHGLFTDDGVVVNLNEVSAELDRYEGNVWTVILSLRREDAVVREAMNLLAELAPDDADDESIALACAEAKTIARNHPIANALLSESEGGGKSLARHKPRRPPSTPSPNTASASQIRE